MFKRLVSPCLAGLLLAGAASALSATPGAPGLGAPLTPAVLAGIELTVLPTGEGLPSGEGSVTEGAALYQQHCQACHGAEGQGGMNGDLVGGVGSLATAAPKKTVTSYWPYATIAFDYIRRAMPYTAPGSLSADEVYAIVAYLLAQDGVVAKDAVLDADRLAAVKMPNAEGFYPGE
ncbi:MAG: c-type cytochrome [Pseudomonadales bacterium]